MKTETKRKKEKKYGVVISLRMPEKLYGELKEISKRETRSINGQILHLVAQALNRPDLIS